MRKKIHIVSHSHWDREWYMPYEQHHMRLITLVDDLLTLFETDPDFKSFHLDGQMIILEDYLQIRPENEERLRAAIQAGKLRIGPFYILQDDFLISSEANVRNMLIGHAESLKWGTPVALGYFPDTFGNMGQTAQLMKKANLEVAAFGRGVKPIAFDNQVLEIANYASQFSEMWWKGPDASQILGILFANWYSNGNEIPVDQHEAKLFWQQKIADADQYAATSHLLMMNGVDHQPVQKNLSEAIRTAQTLFPEYDFIHANFDDYIAAVRQEIPENLGVVEGELTSQETDGWFTLANTASTRVYLKQANTRVERQLENISEPLATMAASVGGAYPHDQLTYAWKLLLQNHPHDSICGCSVDEVHQEMMTRFAKAYEVGSYLAAESLEILGDAVNTAAFPTESKPFVIFNTSGYKKTGEVILDVTLEKSQISQSDPSQTYQKYLSEKTASLKAIDKNGIEVAATVSEIKSKFSYELPKDGFRKSYIEKYVTVKLFVKDMPSFSWETFALLAGRHETAFKSLLADNGKKMENNRLKVVVRENGTLELTDKKSNRVYTNLLTFENCGDIGNEYVFKQPIADKMIYSSDYPASVTILEDGEFVAKIKIEQEWEIPISAAALLQQEQEQITDFRTRKAARSKEVKTMRFDTIVTMYRDDPCLNFETTLVNEMKDHRIRVLFPTALKTELHMADSIYEVVTRPNLPLPSWENPTNPQHQQGFVCMKEGEEGITIGNFGLNEYEIIQENTIAITLLRSVGELGDWGYFPTPGAQCLGEHTFSYSLSVFDEEKERLDSFQKAYTNQIPFSVKQISQHSGQLPAKATYLESKTPAFAVTALKRRLSDEALVMRGFNLTDQACPLVIGEQRECDVLNLLEEAMLGEVNTLSPYEIKTLKINDM